MASRESEMMKFGGDVKLKVAKKVEVENWRRWNLDLRRRTWAWELARRVNLRVKCGVVVA